MNKKRPGSNAGAFFINRMDANSVLNYFSLPNLGDKSFQGVYMIKAQTQYSFEALLAGTQSGETKAIALLYQFLKKESYPVIEKYIINRGGSREDAEDFFQEAFLILVEAIKNRKFKPGLFSWRGLSDQLGAYSMKVVTNLWKKELRWRSRDLKKEDSNPEEILVQDLSSDLIAETYDKLADECRELLALYFKDQLSPRIIAGKLGASTDEIKSRLRKCNDTFVKSVGSLLQENDPQKLHELLKKGLELLEERCQTILEGFYFKKQSMQALADQLNYAHAHVATEQKNRCMKRLNEAVVSILMK